MASDLSAAQDLLSRISKLVRREFPHLKIIWIPYEHGKKADAFQSYHYALDLLPLGKKILSAYGDTPPKGDITDIFTGAPKGLLPKKRKACVCIFVNTSKYDERFAFIFEAFSSLYRVLKTLGMSPHKINAPAPKQKNVISVPPLFSFSEGPERYLESIEHDSFVSLTMAFSLDPSAVKAIPHMRATQALSAVQGHQPSFYGSPHIAEILRILYKEQKDEIKHLKHASVLARSLSYAADIRESFDHQFLSSWANFCQAAQLMAWADLTPEQILGAAVYTSENPYIRADAYLASEISGVEPDMMTHFEFFNPFSDNDMNERNHKRLCMDYFEMAILHAKTQDNSAKFLENAAFHNTAFKDGKILGWCAPAFIEMAKTFETMDLEDAIAQAETVFKEVLDSLPWEIVSKAGILMLRARHKDGIVSYPRALELLKTDEALAPVLRAFQAVDEKSHLL